MKEAPQIIEQKAEDLIRNCFTDIPFCRVEFDENTPKLNDDGIDRVGRLITQTGERPLIVEAKSSGQPRWVRGAVNQLALYRTKNPTAYCIFVAPYITEEAGKIAAENDIGYVDFAGNCRITFDGVYIRRDGQKNKFTRKRDLRSLYSPKGERILRALLGEPKRAWKTEELAETASVSFGQISNVRKLLADREWLKKGTRGIELTNPRELLNEWSENYEFNRNGSQDFFSLDPVATIEEKIVKASEDLGVRYALALFSGAARLAPAMRYQRVSVYVEKADEIVKAASLKRVTSGANVTLLTPYDTGVFFGSESVGGSNVASAIQIYLDLRKTPGRGEEAAEAILREVIEPQW